MINNFITIEGGEGVGKSTQIALLKKHLDKLNQEVLFVREPGSCKISEKIREIILSTDHDEMKDMTETMLYMTSRSQLVHEIILPNLKAGKVVISDRYLDSTLAYQGYARNIGIEKILKIHELTSGNLYPSLTIFLDLDVERAFKRKGGPDMDDRLEQAGKEFHKRVYNGFVKLCEIFPMRIERIDASGSAMETHEKIIKILVDRGIISE